jgi:hypothetical protein
VRRDGVGARDAELAQGQANGQRRVRPPWLLTLARALRLRREIVLDTSQEYVNT